MSHSVDPMDDLVIQSVLETRIKLYAGTCLLEKGDIYNWYPTKRKFKYDGEQWIEITKK